MLTYIALRGMGTLLGEGNCQNGVYLPSEKEYTLNGKNLPPLGANSFLLEYSPFLKGFDVQ